MTDGAVRFCSQVYLTMLVLLLAARGMDLYSTRVATPTLALEGNPLAKKMGWTKGILVNLGIAFAFAFWPMVAVIIATTGFLVAARNFHSAWLMRTMGEEEYREWYLEQLSRTHRPLYIGCLLGETGLTALVGAALIYFSPQVSVGFSIGVGIVGYAVAVLFYTSLSLWRLRHRME